MYNLADLDHWQTIQRNNVILYTRDRWRWKTLILSTNIDENRKKLVTNGNQNTVSSDFIGVRRLLRAFTIANDLVCCTNI